MIASCSGWPTFTVRYVLYFHLHLDHAGGMAYFPDALHWSTSVMSMTRMRMKQLERSGVRPFLCHDASDFAKLPQNSKFWD